MKKVIALLLTVAMLLTMIPAVFADEPFTARKLTDMEDFTNEGLFGNDPCPFSSYQADKMSLTVAPNRGFNGSQAIDQVVTDKNGEWGATICMRNSYVGASWNWSDASIVWIWVDLSGINQNVNFELRTRDTSWSDHQMLIGDTFYLWSGAGAVTTGTTVDAWDGVHGRIPLPKGYVGFVGTDIANFDGQDPTGVTEFVFYAPVNEANQHAYFDEVWLTAANCTPEIGDAVLVTNMEALGDPPTAGVEVNTWDWRDGDVIFAKSADGGYNGSAALSYTRNSTGWGGEFAQIQTGKFGGIKDWSAADTLWFWIDATGFNAEMKLDVMLMDDSYSVKYATPDATAYTWNGTTDPAVPVTIKDRWDGKGTIKLGQDYVGFVGVPLSSFETFDLSSVKGIVLYSRKDESNGTVLVDEIWVTKNGALPGIEIPEPEKETYVQKLTAFEGVSGTSWVSSWQGDNTTFAVVDAHGFNGTNALDYRINNLGSDWGGSFAQISTNDLCGICNWTNAEIVWFWTDLTNVTGQAQLEFGINSNNAMGWMIANKPVWLWNPGEDVTVLTSFNRWDGAGRVNLPADYVGFVGVPFDSITCFEGNQVVTDKAVAWNMTWGPVVSIRNADGPVYIDEIWITTKDARPAVAACDHANIGTIAAVAATCTTTGLTAGYGCPDCGYIQTAQEVVPATGVHAYDISESSDATCTESGSITYVCANCEDTYTDTVPALGHDYTYTNNGDDHTVGCSRCAYSVTEAHTFVEGVCVCGAEEVTENIDSNLTFATVNLQLESYIGADFFFLKTKVADYDSYYVRFTYPTADGDVTEDLPAEEYGKYFFAEHTVAAKEMSDTIQATIYAVKDGVTFHGPTTSWKLKDAMRTKFDGAKSTEADKALCVAILNYGAKAQARFSYNVEDLATSVLTAEEIAAYLPAARAAQSVDATTSNGLTGVSFYKMALSAGSVTVLNIMFTKAAATDIADVECRISYTDRAGVDQVEVIDSFTASGSRFVALFNKLTAKQLGDTISITFYSKTSGEPISETKTFSEESYIALNPSANEAQTALYTALIQYADAAAAKFA